MCNKTDIRMECLKCGYPASEAMFFDREPPFPCDTQKNELKKYVNKTSETGRFIIKEKL